MAKTWIDEVANRCAIRLLNFDPAGGQKYPEPGRGTHGVRDQLLELESSHWQPRKRGQSMVHVSLPQRE